MKILYWLAMVPFLVFSCAAFYKAFTFDLPQGQKLRGLFKVLGFILFIVLIATLFFIGLQGLFGLFS